MLALAHKLEASWTVGFSGNFDAHLCVDHDSHAFDRLFHISQYLEPSLKFDQFCKPPCFSPAAEAAAQRLTAKMLRPGDRLLFVHSETKPEKMWPPERFRWVLDRFLTERPEYRVVAPSLAPIDWGIHPDRITYCNEHLLEVNMALMRGASLFLGIDSCFLHAADLFRVPGVALFGPTGPERWGFRLSPHRRQLVGDVMEAIEAKSVLDALLEIAAEVISPTQMP